MRALKLPLLAVAALISVAACGGNATEGRQEPAQGDHNQADVSFAQGMIPHHRQAIEMADLAESNALSPQVRDLAAQIKAAQGPEIATMTSWLEEWGEPVAAEMGGHSGMGMMDEAEMGDLDAATGAEFDRMFLEMMIEHHRGAVTMAERELEEGQFAPAMELAQNVIDSQNAEIEEMEGLLAGYRAPSSPAPAVQSSMRS